MTIPALYPGEFVAIVVEWDQPFVTGAPWQSRREQPAEPVL